MSINISYVVSELTLEPIFIFSPVQSLMNLAKYSHIKVYEQIVLAGVRENQHIMLEFNIIRRGKAIQIRSTLDFQGSTFQ